MSEANTGDPLALVITFLVERFGFQAVKSALAEQNPKQQPKKRGAANKEADDLPWLRLACQDWIARGKPRDVWSSLMVVGGKMPPSTEPESHARRLLGRLRTKDRRRTLWLLQHKAADLMEFAAPSEPPILPDGNIAAWFAADMRNSHQELCRIIANGADSLSCYELSQEMAVLFAIVAMRQDGAQQLENIY